MTIHSDFIQNHPLLTEALATPTPLLGVSGPMVLVGLVAVGAIAAFVFHKQFRTQMLISKALKQFADGEKDLQTLKIGGQTAPVTKHFNGFVTELAELRDRGLAEDAAAAWQTGEAGGGGLAKACGVLGDGLMVCDATCMVSYMNPAAGRLLGLDHEDLTGRSADTALQRHGIKALFETATKAGRSESMEIRADDDDPRRGVLKVTIRPVAGEDQVAIVVQDVTQQRVAEESRHEFVAKATHELRMPLTNMRLYVENIQDLDETEVTERAKALNVINDEIIRLDRMIGEVLSLSEVESGAMAVQRDDVRLDELLRGVIEDYRAQAIEKGVDLGLELPPKLPVVQADQEKIVLAIHNVVGNAVKYTPSGGRVSVTASETPGYLSIEVNDTGLGINHAEQDKIFDRFYRAGDKRVRELTGTGLGLAISRDIIRLHGGDVTVISQLDQGSTFTITIPAQSQELRTAA